MFSKTYHSAIEALKDSRGEALASAVHSRDLGEKLFSRILAGMYLDVFSKVTYVLFIHHTSISFINFFLSAVSYSHVENDLNYTQGDLQLLSKSDFNFGEVGWETRGLPWSSAKFGRVSSSNRTCANYSSRWRVSMVSAGCFHSIIFDLPLALNYFTSSDPHRDIILLYICHKFWHSLC